MAGLAAAAAKGWPRWLSWARLTVAAVAAVVWSVFAGDRMRRADLTAAAEPAVKVDRCCEDLDGGGAAHDGILIIARRDETVLGLSVYEDRDWSGDFSADDVIRFAQGSRPSMEGPLPRGVVTLDRCCADYDTGGYEDDGIFVVSVPPDRILLAAVYEDRDGSRTVSAADLVRYVLR